VSSTGQGGNPGTAVGGTPEGPAPTQSVPAASSGDGRHASSESGAAARLRKLGRSFTGEPEAPTPPTDPTAPGSFRDPSPTAASPTAASPTAASPTAATAPPAYRPQVAPSGAGASGAAVSAAAGAAGAATATRPQSRAEATGRVPRSGPQGQQRRTSQGQPPRPGATRRVTTRRVKLAIARVDPWSVMKMSFLLAVAAGIAGVVLTAVLWLILSGMGVFSDIDRVVGEIQPSTTTAFTLMNYIGFGRVVSLSIVLGVIDIILMTALATLAAFLYNICSALVGGIQLTLTDD
jgi:Transmembrane domain of unknown function (DUF3566)